MVVGIVDFICLIFDILMTILGGFVLAAAASDKRQDKSELWFPAINLLASIVVVLFVTIPWVLFYAWWGFIEQRKAQWMAKWMAIVRVVSTVIYFIISVGMIILATVLMFVHWKMFFIFPICFVLVSSFILLIIVIVNLLFFRAIWMYHKYGPEDYSTISPYQN